MLGRWWRRRATRPVAFDAVLDVDVDGLAPGVRPERAMVAVDERVRRMPGAGLVRVRIRPAAAAVVARVFGPGTSVEPSGEAWAALRSRVEAEALLGLRALVPHARPAAAAPGGRPQLAGFAEGPAARYGGALAQLALLAQGVSSQEMPAPVAEDGMADEETGRLTALLGFVLPGEGREVAERAMRRFGSFAGVLAAPAMELQAVPGLGPHCVAAIKLVHEAAVRLARAGMAGQQVLSDPVRLDDYLTAALARERVEQFRVLFLDADGMLLADELQASGTVNHTPVYPREVMRRALELRAVALVLVHNHPSGDPTPSRDDVEMTRQVAAAARVLRIGLRDHIIVGNGRSTSFRAEGLLG